MSKGVGDRIAQLRGSMKIGDFAECLGVNRKTITRWEAGEALPDGSSLLALHESFGASPTWVLLGEVVPGAEVPISGEESLLLEKYRQSPVALRDAALRVLLGEKPATRTFKEVGQYIEGSVNQAGLTLNVGGKRKK
ncbi:helix-turn-helix domain-containing protein [Pseudomonas sichuanensis]|uniref:helix-turn-helix domain-containing protein n=1 Tax=Pseudomonas sichuanensis TaxID=2213015 RepID=UPI0021607C6F|nr:helix-turn-helix domain-containing protein [Pseudomonas sichuanensis]UVK85209.1 helix-turn-helix domain-containing protein [Pseudomonas sichuanensis]